MMQFRKSVSVFALALVSIVMNAQVSDKFSVDALVMVEQATTSRGVLRTTTDQRLPFIIRIDENHAAETIEALRNAGAVLRSRIGSQISVEIPLNRLNEIEAIEGVVRIGTAGAAPKPMTDVTRKEIGVSAIDGTEGNIGDMAYTGKGVTVAVIDTGFDLQHPSYKDSEGRTRIKAYYTPFENGGNPVIIDGIQLPGSVYDTPEQIAQLTTDSQRNIHGTHTSIIAAGTRSEQGWGGMAPDADIVLCAYIDDSQEPETTIETMNVNPTVFDALAFLKHYQETSGKPMAVSMSIGNIAGPHNGRDEMPQAITDFIAPGRLVAIASGNEGDYPTHLRKVFSSDKDTLRTMTRGDDLQLEGFTKEKAPLSAQLTLYEVRDANGDIIIDDLPKNAKRWTKIWNSPIVSTDANNTYKMDSHDTPEMEDIYRGEIYMKLAFDETLNMTRLKCNIFNGLTLGYAFELSVWSTAGTQIDFFNANMETMGRENCTGSITELSGNNWAVSNKAVSVGNYCANTTYKSLFYEEEDACPILGDISSSSSYGKAQNNRQIPMVAAPGTNIISGINHYIAIKEDGTERSYRQDMTWKGGLYDCESGTSMSTPVVAGVIALWLQANPTLSYDELEDIFKDSCRNDEFTAAKPERFGYGKVDAKKGLELVLQRQATDINTIYTPTANNSAIYDLQGRRVLQPTRGVNIIRYNDGTSRKVIVK